MVLPLAGKVVSMTEDEPGVESETDSHKIVAATAP